jgi:branched-chain amino acid transport system ATP-binding protein
MQNMQLSARQPHEGVGTIFSKFSSEVNAEAEILLEFVDLYNKRCLLAGELSFGQQKLLEFAMALMNRPKMLLLDEPTAGINQTLVKALIDRLKRANLEFGITLLIIEHNMQVIMNLAQHVYCMARGEMLASGPPESIQSDWRVVDAYFGVH